MPCWLLGVGIVREFLQSEAFATLRATDEQLCHDERMP